MGQNERLRLVILNSGMTAASLAEVSGVDRKTCGRWVTHGQTPRLAPA